MERIEITQEKLEELFDCIINSHECNCGYEPDEKDIKEVHQIIKQILQDHNLVNTILRENKCSVCGDVLQPLAICIKEKCFDVKIQKLIDRDKL